MKVKQVLDEVTIDTITNLGYDIDYSIDNLKLFLMALACGFALYAQFFTKPFPESRFVLGVCFVMYFFLSGVLQAILYFIDKEIILRIKSIKQDSKNNKIKEGTLSSSFPRYQEFYTLTFQLKSNQTTKNNKNDTNEKVVGVMYVGKYFTSKGEFLEVSYYFIIGLFLYSVFLLTLLM